MPAQAAAAIARSHAPRHRTAWKPDHPDAGETHASSPDGVPRHWRDVLPLVSAALARPSSSHPHPSVFSSALSSTPVVAFRGSCLARPRAGPTPPPQTPEHPQARTPPLFPNRTDNGAAWRRASFGPPHARKRKSIQKKKSGRHAPSKTRRQKGKHKTDGARKRRARPGQPPTAKRGLHPTPPGAPPKAPPEDPASGATLHGHSLGEPRYLCAVTMWPPAAPRPRHP